MSRKIRSLGMVSLVSSLLVPAACSRAPAPPQPQGTPAAAAPVVTERGVAPGGLDPAAESVDAGAILAPFESLAKVHEPQEGASAAALDWNQLLGGYDPSEKPDGVKERSGEIRILGCELSLDFAAVQRCLDRKIRDLKDDVEKQVRAAQNELKATFTKQLQAAQAQAQKEITKATILLDRYKDQVANLNGQLKTLQASVQAEVDKQMRQAQTEAAKLASDLKAQLQSAQQLAARAQEQAARELQRATNLQATVENLQAQLEKAGKDLGLDLDWQKQLFAAMQALRLDQLFRCLGDQAKAGQTDALKTIQEFTRDPVRFVQKSLEGVIRQFGGRFDQLMGEELREMAAGRPFPTGPALVKRAFDKFAILAEATGGRCLFDHVRPDLERSANIVAQVATQAAAQLQAEASRVFEESIAPAIFKAMSSTLQGVLREQLNKAGIPGAGSGASLPAGLDKLLLTEDEMKGVARTVLYRRNVRERFDTAQINMKSILDPAAAQATVSTSLANLRKLVQGTKDYETLYLEIGVELVRAMAHKYMRSKEPGHGGHLLDQAIGLLQTGEGTVEKVVSALCGLIPEAGAAICAVIEEVVELAWSNVAAVAIEGIAQDLINGAIDKLVDTAREQLMRKQNLAAIRSSAGPLGDILRALPHEQAIGLWAGAIMNDEMEMLNRHFASLVDLASRARS